MKYSIGSRVYSEEFGWGTIEEIEDSPRIGRYHVLPDNGSKEVRCCHPKDNPYSTFAIYTSESEIKKAFYKVKKEAGERTLFGKVILLFELPLCVIYALLEQIPKTTTKQIKAMFPKIYKE